MEAAAHKPWNRRSGPKSLESSPGEKPFRRFHRRGFEEEKQQIPKRRRISKNVVLPEDIIHQEILTRLPLPTKSILRCQVVCESWYSLLSDPKFLKSHLARQQSCSEQEEEDLFIAKKADTWTDHGISIISRTQEFHVPMVPQLSTDVTDVLILGSINGLVCVSGKDGKQQFSLWNPATAQAKKINLPSHNCRKNYSHSVGGFSWDPVLNDYKLVVVCCACKRSPPSSFLVYSSNSATWTEEQVTDSVLPPASVFRVRLGINGMTPPSTLVKGIPYWTYSHYLTVNMRRRKFITTFKFVAEYNEFRLLPDLDTTKIRGKTFNIVNMKDSLVGMAYKEGCQDCNVDIYSLDEESPSGVWSKMYTIGPIDLSGLFSELSQCFKNGGEILILKSDTKLCFYDRETRETKDIESDCDTCPDWIFNYTPSLVRVKGMKLMKQ